MLPLDLRPQAAGASLCFNGNEASRDMGNCLRFALGMLATLPFGVVLAKEESASPVPVACEVSGYAVVIRNTGSRPIPADTKILWSVPFVRMQGEHNLRAALEPGGASFVSAALGSNFLGADTPCDASFGEEGASERAG
jgi:hypothetical protein